MSRPRILVIDDTPANQRLLEAILTPHGYDVSAAASGPEGIEAIAASAPDLVVLDIQMPGMNGYEVCRRIREQEATALLPVVMVTSERGEEKRLALEAGADDFARRPVDQAELLARVRSLLRIKAYQDTIRAQAAEQAEWNRSLTARVQAQVDELETLRELRRFLSPQLAEAVLSSGDSPAEPHRREIAVVFCDLRGFTAFASSVEPEEVLAVIRAFHETLGGLVARYGATVGFFAGDGVMLFFNDPIPCEDPAGRAVALAIELRDAMEEHVERWARDGHSLGIAVSVALGFATLGMLGFEGRYDYSAIGPVVNLASRLCDEAGAGDVIVDRRVRGEVEDQVDAVPVGELSLRGFPTPVPAWRVTGYREAPATDGPPTAAAGTVEFRVLGSLEVRSGDRTLPVPGGKERTLLALLLLDANRPVSVDRLAEDLWAGQPPDSGGSALRVYVSRLRRFLAQAGAEDALVTRPQGYELCVAENQVDADRFGRMAAAGRDLLDRGRCADAAETLGTALGLWRGPAYADVAGSPAAVAETARLEEARLAAIEDRIEAELGTGRHRELIGELEVLVGANPYRERLWGQRMLALYRSGRQAEALRAFQELRSLLGEELGLTPSPALAQLEQSILVQDPALEPADL